MNRIEGLDGLRGYAALLVLAFHTCARAGVAGAQGGYLAVDVFFVMSGYVVAHAYDARLPEIGFWGFCRLRLIRFYPLYFIGALLGLLLYGVYIVFGHSVDFTPGQALFGAFLPNLLFLPIVSDHFGDNLFMNPPAWSLMFELAINFAYAAAYPWLGRSALMAIVALGALGVGVCAYVFSGVSAGSGDPALLIGLARVSYSFPLGVLLHRQRQRLPHVGWLGPLTPATLALATWSPPSFWRDVVFVLALSPAIVVIARDARPALPRLAAFLATISYCLYIIHEPILLLASAASNRFAIHPPPLFGGLAIALVFVAWALDRYYDAPARAWLSRIVPRPAGLPRFSGRARDAA